MLILCLKILFAFVLALHRTVEATWFNPHFRDTYKAWDVGAGRTACSGSVSHWVALLGLELRSLDS